MQDLTQNFRLRITVHLAIGEPCSDEFEISVFNLFLHGYERAKQKD